MITQATLTGVKYPPERLVDGFLGDLAALKPIMPAPLALEGLDGMGLLAEFGDLSAVPQSDATLQLVVDAVSYPPRDQVLLSQLQTERRERLRLPATRSLLFNWQGATSPPPNPLQSAWSLWVWPPTTSDRIQLGMPMGPEDARLARLLPGGYAPALFPREVVRRLYRGGRTVEWANTIDVAPSSSVAVNQQRTGLIDLTPPAGRFWVLLGVDVDASAGGSRTLLQQVGDALTITIARDGTDPFLTLPAGATLYGPSTTGRIFGWRPVLPSRSRLLVYLTTQTALTGVAYRVRARELVEQPLHRALWGLPGGPADLREAVRSGALALPA